MRITRSAGKDVASVRLGSELSRGARRDSGASAEMKVNDFESLEKAVVAVKECTTSLRNIILQETHYKTKMSHPNPLNRFGCKCFSQSDEDGITIEIIRRLGLLSGTFAEFGVGNGMENNTIILGSLGWRGFWVGGQELAFDSADLSRLFYIKDWITLENIVGHTETGLAAINATDLDLISLDLDGNDIYFVEELLSRRIRPAVFIVEYNAKFSPPSKFQIKYDPNHHWTADDYFGAALQNFVELFSRFGYVLVCCNGASGANAFFIRNEFSVSFRDIPTDVRDIYVPPRYHLYSAYGHRASPRVIETIFS